MENKTYYLKENVILEALYNNWYAWPLLVSPGTAPLYIKNSHLKIMKSYVKNPMIHAAAVKNPKMLGGPFIDYEGKRVDEIEALMNKTIEENQELLEFADAVKELNELLVNEAKGDSLEELYQKVPELLKGYVELMYDVNNQPSFRFIEAMLYQSKYYKEELQSILFSEVDKDNRSFVLSTPRIADEKYLQLHLPFRHEGINKVFRMKKEPQSLEYVKAALELSDEQLELFKRFLTEEKTIKKTHEPVLESEIRVRYFGHACVLIETNETSILIDPFISYDYQTDIERFTHFDLPDEIDYVLITHNHQDHVLLETLLQLRHKVKQIVVPRNGNGNLEDPSLKLFFKAIGFKNVVEVDELEEINIPDGVITNLPFFGEHADLKIRSKTAHLVKIKGKSILLAADSSNLEIKLYKRLADIIGNIDVIFIGMESQGAPLSWLYGSLMTKPLERKHDQSRRLNGSGFTAAQGLVQQFNPKEVYVYAMGIEPWTMHILAVHYEDDSQPILESNQLIEACTEQGIRSERLSIKKEIILN